MGFCLPLYELAANLYHKIHATSYFVSFSMTPSPSNADILYGCLPNDAFAMLSTEIMGIVVPAIGGREFGQMMMAAEERTDGNVQSKAKGFTSVVGILTI